jgi:ribosomal protein L11 methyltransferase
MDLTARLHTRPSQQNAAGRLVPDTRLYIYYFKGRVRARRADLGRWFIGHWEEDDCSFIFSDAPVDDEMRMLAQQDPALLLADRFDMSYGEWQPLDGLPLAAGGFYLCPPWASQPPAADYRRLVLDPGLVFGSGCHATTHDCLEALEIVCYNDENKIETAVDIGTGTGVLAVAAALNGIKRVIGVDNNLLAAETAGHNVTLNKVDDKVLIIKGSALAPAYRQADLIMANIHYDVMDDIIDSPLFHGSRWFILSGLLRTPAGKILERLKNFPVEIIKIWNSDEIWYTVLGKARGENEPKSI